MARTETQPTLAQAAHTLATILGVIVRMSDDAKNAASPLDQHSNLLRLQNSIQTNAARIAPHVQAVLTAIEAEKAAGDAADGARAALEKAREVVAVVADDNCWEELRPGGPGTDSDWFLRGGGVLLPDNTTAVLALIDAELARA